MTMARTFLGERNSCAPDLADGCQSCRTLGYCLVFEIFFFWLPSQSFMAWALHGRYHTTSQCGRYMLPLGSMWRAMQNDTELQEDGCFAQGLPHHTGILLSVPWCLKLAS